MPQQYGSQMRSGPSMGDYLWYAGSAAVAGYGIYNLRSSAGRLMKEMAGKEISAIDASINWAKHNLDPAGKQTAVSQISKILNEPVTSWREAAKIGLSRHPIVLAMEQAS